MGPSEDAQHSLQLAVSEPGRGFGPSPTERSDDVATFQHLKSPRACILIYPSEQEYVRGKGMVVTKLAATASFRNYIFNTEDPEIIAELRKPKFNGELVELGAEGPINLETASEAEVVEVHRSEKKYGDNLLDTSSAYAQKKSGRVVRPKPA